MMRVTKLFAILAVTGLAASFAQAAENPRLHTGGEIPRFRQAEPEARPPALDKARPYIFAADRDFPPFSYADQNGEARGLAVDMVRSACTALEITCSFRLVGWNELKTAAGTDGTIAGLQIEDDLLKSYMPTRPIYRALGRFAVRRESTVAAPDIEAFAGKRIGAVAGSAHAAWLQRYFPDSEIVTSPSLAEAEDNIRNAKTDALFADGLQLIYWTHGEVSQNCCRLLDGAFVDESFFSRPFVIFVRRENEALRKALDVALDRIQESGETTKIFNLYVPASLW
jgi:polar amino acid transport system substrate-binding protein